MNIHLRRTFSLLWPLMAVIGFCLPACVSVNIGAKPGERSKGVEFQVPAKPYEALSKTAADGAWQNSVNGSSISYFSTCNDPADPSLDTVARDLFSGLTDLRVVGETQPMFNGRASLDTEVEGKVDGVPTRIRALIFKKNGCTYTLSHVAIVKAFEADRKTFDGFIRTFHAP